MVDQSIIQRYITRLCQLRAQRLESEIIALLDAGATLDEITIVHPNYPYGVPYAERE